MRYIYRVFAILLSLFLGISILSGCSSGRMDTPDGLKDGQGVDQDGKIRLVVIAINRKGSKSRDWKMQNRMI
jgi:hypothetical protein